MTTRHSRSQTRRIQAISALSLTAILLLTMWSQAQGKHASTVEGAQDIQVLDTARNDTAPIPGGAGLSFVYYPTVTDDRFDNPLGVEASFAVPTDLGMLIKFTAAYEAWECRDWSPFRRNDADLFPLGIGLMYARKAPLSTELSLEAGLRYVIVDYQDIWGRDYDDAVTGIVGGGITFASHTGMGLGVHVAYQFDIEDSESRNDVLTLEGLQGRLTLRFPL